jgi:hypothetical protein
MYTIALGAVLEGFGNDVKEVAGGIVKIGPYNKTTTTKKQVYFSKTI